MGNEAGRIAPPCADEDITEEWLIIEQRVTRRDLATDEEVEKAFSRYRGQRAAITKEDLKALLAAAPLEGIDLERLRDISREIDLES